MKKGDIVTHKKANKKQKNTHKIVIILRKLKQKQMSIMEKTKKIWKKTYTESLGKSFKRTKRQKKENTKEIDTKLCLKKISKIQKNAEKSLIQVIQES